MKKGFLEKLKVKTTDRFLNLYRYFFQPTWMIKQLLIEHYINENLFNNQKYQDEKRLNRFEYQIFSQNGEDGIIEEIFKRIGVTNQFFVEFGVSNGLENNTAALLLQNWKGVWLEGSRKYVQQITSKFKSLLDRKKLAVQMALVNAENVESLFCDLQVPAEFDLLSIDIDGNDYWVWKAIRKFSPRVVVIEYNAQLRSHIRWVMKYNPNHCWNYTCYFGASLKSLELLGREKGYQLVGCDFRGANAFFVRQDLVADHFLEPFTAENHYEPPKHHLLNKAGHRRDFGDFEPI